MSDGGTSRVYRALDTRTGRDVALKVVETGAHAMHEALRREAKVLSRISHAGVARLVDAHLEAERPFVALAWIEGEDLAARLRRQGPLDVATALSIVEQIAGALDHVHAARIVHRDIKPSNVMVGRTGAVIVDFGLALDRVPSPPTTSDRARRWSVEGTPEYMAPEQVLGMERAISPATDRYGLAALALELLTGRRPYEPMPVARTLFAVLERPPRRPSALGLRGAGLDALFAKAMARDPHARFAHCGELVGALREVAPTIVRTTSHDEPLPDAATVRMTGDALRRAA